MRFAIVFAVALGLCHAGCAFAEDASRKSVGAKKQRATERQRYNQRQEDPIFKEIKSDLESCLKGKLDDPSLPLLRAKLIFGHQEQMGFTDAEWDALSKKREKLGSQILAFLDRIAEDDLEFRGFKAFVVWRYNLDRAKHNFGKFVPNGYPGGGKEPVDLLTTRNLGASRLPKVATPAAAIKHVQATLEKVRNNEPGVGCPALCRQVWNNKLLAAAYLIEQWELTCDEVPAYAQWQPRAKQVAIQEARELLDELEGMNKPYTEFISFTEERVDFLCEIASFEEFGTTEETVRTLIKKKRTEVR